MSLVIPSKLAEKAAGFEELSYGANSATLVLRGGRKISGVVLAWGCEIIKINDRVVGEENLGFKMEDIVDILPSV